jgi:hypothetical protein
MGHELLDALKIKKNRLRVIFWRKSPLLLVGQDGVLLHIMPGNIDYFEHAPGRFKEENNVMQSLDS